jgi:hypothetical protein
MEWYLLACYVQKREPPCTCPSRRLPSSLFSQHQSFSSLQKEKRNKKIALRIFSVIQNHVVARPLWDAHLVLKMDHHCGRGEERHLRLIMMVMKVRVVCGREDGKKLARGFY